MAPDAAGVINLPINFGVAAIQSFEQKDQTILLGQMTGAAIVTFQSLGVPIMKEINPRHLLFGRALQKAAAWFGCQIDVDGIGTLVNWDGGVSPGQPEKPEN